jgi:hypothetical protein
MPNLTTNSASHRTRIVAEAVVSAYIREISQPAVARVQARAGEATAPASARVPAPRPMASSSRLSRPRSHALELPRRRFLELSA